MKGGNAVPLKLEMKDDAAHLFRMLEHHDPEELDVLRRAENIVSSWR